MADNVFDKLDEQSEILARIDKNTANESSTVEEMIRTNDPRMIEFVKTADRVFVYRGDKSELNRKNKKCRISCIKKMILTLIQIATVLSAIYVPYMWCVLILNLIVYSYPIYKAITFKPSAYKIKYDDFVKRSDGIYDDNGIMCGNDDEKWYFIFLRVAAIILPFVNAFTLFFFPSILGGFHIYMIVLAALDFITWCIAIRVFSERHNRYYDIYFIKDDISVSYEYLKDFMQRNNLK